MSSTDVTFSFDSLDCDILKEKAAAFYSPIDLHLTFDVLVGADGNVRYVRSPRIDRDFSELRLACTSALYSYAFRAVDPTKGERWFKPASAVTSSVSVLRITRQMTVKAASTAKR